MKKNSCGVFALLLYGGHAFANIINDPCAGPYALLALIDRPTISYSSCVVAVNHAVLEMGYQYQQLMQGSGHQQNFPQAELRIGLPANNEFVIFIPNYIYQSVSPHSGFTASTLGVKHEFFYTEKWIAAANFLVTQSNGSAAFGSKQTGIETNGIVTYDINSKWNSLIMLGFSTESEPSLQGGKRFTTINADVVLTYSFSPVLNIYGELYRQSKTSPDDGQAVIFDGGIEYLPFPRFEIDAEAGQRISGTLGNVNHYFAAGMSVLF